MNHSKTLGSLSTLANGANRSRQNSFSKSKNSKSKELQKRSLSQERNSHKVTDWSPFEIANQLTLLDFKHFSQITSKELDTDIGWTKKDKFIRAPNIVAMTRRFNHTVLFVQREILKFNTVKERRQMLVFFINVILELKKERLKNYHSLVAIVGALQSAPIYRLKATWDKLRVKEKLTWQELEELTSIEDKRARLRVCIEKMDKRRPQKNFYFQLT